MGFLENWMGRNGPWRLLKVTMSERANASPTHLGRTNPFSLSSTIFLRSARAGECPGTALPVDDGGEDRDVGSLARGPLNPSELIA